MKFTILKTNLLNALNTVSKAISNKNPNAILTGVKLELNELGLTLIGTDTDISISTFINKNDGDEQIRIYHQPQPAGPHPLDGGWFCLTDENKWDFPAIGFHVARHIRQARGVAVGIVCCYQGASVIQSFLPPSRQVRSNFSVSIRIMLRCLMPGGISLRFCTKGCCCRWFRSVILP